MNKIFTLTLVMLHLTVAIFAQSKPGLITGSVADANAKIIEAANISLLKASDSSVVKTVASDKKGKFVFENLTNGRYLVSISAVGYQSNFSNIIAITPENTSSV